MAVVMNDNGALATPLQRTYRVFKEIPRRIPLIQPNVTTPITAGATQCPISTQRLAATPSEATYTPIPKGYYEQVAKQAPQTTAWQPTQYSPSQFSYARQQVKITGTGDTDNTEDANEKLKKAQQEQKYSTYSKMAEAFTSMAEAYQYTRDVKSTKKQYETQKKIIDSNIESQESVIMDNFKENMAQVDAMAAGKNVDLSSGALLGTKSQGLMDMGKDFRDAREQANLNKKALDLEYAMNVKSAARNQLNTAVSSGLSLGVEGLKYL